MSVLQPLTLSFRDSNLEHAYTRAMFPRLRQQGRAAILVGIFVYVLCGLLDPWFVPPESQLAAWITRLIALSVPVVVLAISFTSYFRRLSQLLLAFVCLAAGFGVIGIQTLLPLSSAPYYYPLMVLVTFYTYNFIGIRFIYALAADLFLLLCYNLVFGGLKEYPLHVLLANDTFIVSANLIGGAAGYITERQKRIIFLRETELEQQRHYHLQRSLHDSLTGLPNRELLYDRIGQAMASAHRENARHCALFIDLDGFKAVNDQFGHAVGDQLLQAVAQRLRTAVRETDTVARIAGDEFMVLALGVATEDKAQQLAAKALEQIKQPLPEFPNNLTISASIGICLFPQPGMSVADIIAQADTAMYEIKGHRKRSVADAV